MSEVKKNVEFIRIFAIFMTVMIHVSNFYIERFDTISNTDFLFSVCYNSLSRICVPLFFMISGIFLIGREFDKHKYFERVIKFTIILIVWSLIYFLYNNEFNFDNFFFSFFTSLFNANRTSRHLWFLYAIIGIYIALPFINAMCKNLTREQENLFLTLWLVFSGLVVIFVPLSRYITKSEVDITYPIPIINSAYYLGYFISGHILYERFKNSIPNKRNNILLILIYLLCTAISVFFTYYLSLKNGEFFDAFTWYRSIFIAVASITVFLIMIINKDLFKSKVILILSKSTFGIYLIHILVLDILKNCSIMKLPPIVSIPLITLIVYLISFGLSFILSKIPIIKRIL